MRGFASGGLLVTGMHWQGQSTQQLPTLSEQDDVQLHGGQAGERVGDASRPQQQRRRSQPYGRQEVEEVGQSMRQLSFDDSMGVPNPTSAAESRWYCPVPSCPCHDSLRSAGWASFASMRPHLAQHAAGRLQGEVPPAFLQANRLTRCEVCSKILSTRYGRSCPRCRPELLRSLQPAPVGRPIPADIPSLKDIFGAETGCKSYVPTGAKKLWADCLVTALAQVVQHNDLRAWLELLMLPKCVLSSSMRGGKQHKQRAERRSKEICQSWLEGHRGSLWSLGRERNPGRKKEASHAR